MLSGVIPADSDIGLVQPTQAFQGQTLTIAITGVGSHFIHGISVARFSGSGIMVNSTMVHSPTSATANITVAPDALPFTRDVFVSTGNEVTAMQGAFVVLVPGFTTGHVFST